MLQLMVTNEDDSHVIAIQKFLNWQNICFQTVLNPNDVKYLNQGNDTPLLMKDSMIVAHGFYEIINYVKVEGVNLYETD